MLVELAVSIFVVEVMRTGREVGYIGKVEQWGH